MLIAGLVSHSISPARSNLVFRIWLVRRSFRTLNKAIKAAIALRLVLSDTGTVS